MLAHLCTTQLSSTIKSTSWIKRGEYLCIQYVTNILSMSTTAWTEPFEKATCVHGHSQWRPCPIVDA